MTQDEIIRMALEAGFEVDEGLFPFEATEDKFIGTERVLERFAAIVAAHEREACAKVCEDLANNPMTGVLYSWKCAAAIRGLK